MDIHLYICLLIDFYGQLLTKKQYEILDLYYNNDYSLAEISGILGISRQAVSDNKKRACDSLLRYEEMLQMVGKHNELCREIDSVKKQLQKLKKDRLDEKDRALLEDAEERLMKLDKEI